MTLYPYYRGLEYTVIDSNVCMSLMVSLDVFVVRGELYKSNINKSTTLTYSVPR